MMMNCNDMKNVRLHNNSEGWLKKEEAKIEIKIENVLKSCKFYFVVYGYESIKIVQRFFFIKLKKKKEKNILRD